jgi:hypothetical protein
MENLFPFDTLTARKQTMRYQKQELTNQQELTLKTMPRNGMVHLPVRLSTLNSYCTSASSTVGSTQYLAIDGKQ